MSNKVAKLIFAGSVGSGKTTAITSLSDVPPVKTDQLATDDTAMLKLTTTVAMDYGFMSMDDGTYVHLYGTPGQDRFDFMWEILSKGGLGLILMVNAANPDPIADVDYYMSRFTNFINETALIIGITHVDVGDVNLYGKLQQHLTNKGLIIPVYEVDARATEQVKVLVDSLLMTLAYKD